MTTMLTRRLLAGLLLLPLAAPAWALEPTPYVTSSKLDLAIILPPPVVAGTPVDAAEQATVIAAQAQASPERIQRAAADAEETVFDMFASTLGDRFAPARLPLTTLLFARIGASEDATVDPVKKIFGRVRPWLANPTAIKVLIPKSSSGAYPSGHTTRVTVSAIILASMLPDQRDAIWARAADYAQSRVIGGMHYPNDLEGGRRAGTAMAAVMLTQPDFQADLAAARAELRAAMGM